MSKKSIAKLAGNIIFVMPVVGSVGAQDVPKKTEALEEVIVTGTQIRGIAPAGSAVISVTQEEVKATGATSTNRLLATMPQVANYSVPCRPSVADNSGAMRSSQSTGRICGRCPQAIQAAARRP